MPKIRVLIVDDAVVVRRVVANVLSEDPELEVVGTAPGGRIALAKLTQVNPDAITLDVEMPEMDGLQTLAEIRKTHPLIPVIIFSTVTERGAAITIDALSLGANDYVTKPANVGSVTAAMQRIREELIPKIKALCGRSQGQGKASPRAEQAPREKFTAPDSATPIIRHRGVDVIAIGISTGGPNALAKLIPDLPADFPVPIVIVQHMPPIFTKILADRLNSQSAISVREAVQGDKLAPGHVWVAPGDHHMFLVREDSCVRIELQQGPPENSCRPAADVLFRSVAEVFGSRSVAVVMTGMGQDGLYGCRLIREKGGQVLAQDEETSVVWGMPGYVVNAGLADRVLSLDQIAPEIGRRALTGRSAAIPSHPRRPMTDTPPSPQTQTIRKEEGPH